MPAKPEKRRKIVAELYGEKLDSLPLVLHSFRSLELLINEGIADAFGGELPDDLRRTSFNVRLSLAVALNVIPAAMKDPLGRLKALRDEFAHAQRADLVSLTPSDGKKLYGGMKVLSPDVDTALPGFKDEDPEVILRAFLALLEVGMIAYMEGAKQERAERQAVIDERWSDRRIRTLHSLFGDDVDPRAVEQALALLPDRERAVFTLRYYERTPLAGVAKVLGITRQSAREIELQVIKKIRAVLAK